METRPGSPGPGRLWRGACCGDSARWIFIGDGPAPFLGLGNLDGETLSTETESVLTRRVESESLTDWLGWGPSLDRLSGLSVSGETRLARLAGRSRQSGLHA